MSWSHSNESIGVSSLSVGRLEELSWIVYKMDLNVIIPMILFVVLTPGVLLALPPGQSLLIQSVTHALVFGAVYYGLRITFPQYY